MSTNFDDFKRSLDALVNQATHTAQLGLSVVKEELETLSKPQNLPEQMDELRRNMQTMAHEVEAKAKELVTQATTLMNQRGGFPSPAPKETPSPDPVSHHEAATAAGAGTPQTGSDSTETNYTAGGEAPKQ